MADQPFDVLRRLAMMEEARPYVATAVAEAASKLAPRLRESVELLLDLESRSKWEADDETLRALVDGLGSGGGERRALVVETLLACVTPELDATVLGILQSTVERASGSVGWVASRERFFEAAGRQWPAPADALPTFVRIDMGEFLMGSPETEADRDPDEWPQRKVVFEAPFSLAEMPVTAAQYATYATPKRVTEMSNRGAASAWAQLPAVEMSWWAARGFCAWIGARLPSDAEWEYACRAGTTTRFWSGDTEEDLARVGWYEGNSELRLHDAGEKPPNPWGLFDMHGNLYEWCEDWFHRSSDGAPRDGSAWIDRPGVIRVVRGGTFGNAARDARAAYRSWYGPGAMSRKIGFRPARSICQ
jgi:formylglycine-generating enzyme required for sulfatase activity